MAVPMIVTEEHHESLLVWAHAVEQGWLPASGNALLHIDEHADWALPRPRCRLPTAPCSAAAAARLVYGELDIADFLWVAVYQGLFARICWLRRMHRAKPEMRRRHLFVCPVDGTGRRLITGTCGADGGVPQAVRDGARTVWWHLVDPDGPWPLGPSVVLSIDLDYFASHPAPHHPCHRLEVTDRELRAFCDDPYHLLRISPGARIVPRIEGDRRFLVFNPPQAPAAVPRSWRAAARAALAQLDTRLGGLEAAPAVITIARSVHSGYTPPELAAELEEAVVGRLAAHFDLAPIDLPSIWAAAGHSGLRLQPEGATGGR